MEATAPTLNPDDVATSIDMRLILQDIQGEKHLHRLHSSTMLGLAAFQFSLSYLLPKIVATHISLMQVSS